MTTEQIPNKTPENNEPQFPWQELWQLRSEAETLREKNAILKAALEKIQVEGFKNNFPHYVANIAKSALEAEETPDIW